MSIGLLSNFISGFGIKRFKPARFASHIENAANSSNPAVRNEAMNCYKSLYLWVGDAVETFIDKLKQQ